MRAISDQMVIENNDRKRTSKAANPVSNNYIRHEEECPQEQLPSGSATLDPIRKTTRGNFALMGRKALCLARFEERLAPFFGQGPADEVGYYTNEQIISDKV